MKKLLFLISLCITIHANAWQRQAVWAKNKMPDAQPHQIAAMTNETNKAGFKANDHRGAYLEWYDTPPKEVANGGCMILISGGSYMSCCDVDLINLWRETFTKQGFQCVNFVYRTPRPEGLPIYQSAWEDGQRAVRLVRSQAKKRGYDPNKIGTVSMSAGSHLALMLATSSTIPAYTPIDALDSLPCNINYAIVNAPAYVTTDGETGTPAWLQGYGLDVKLSSCFKFDANTCPMSLHHGGTDIYSPNGSTLIYRKPRSMNIPSELHLYPNRGHGAFGLERGIEFLTQLGVTGILKPEERIMDRYASDNSRREVIRQDVWVKGQMPNTQNHQLTPYIEWHFPKKQKTKAIQIIYSGGGYEGNNPNDFEVAPARRYLNDLGMTVVTLRYRTPRPKGLHKHITAWEDLQRTIRLVRSQAEKYGLDPSKIGIMGSSAGGHLTLMGVTSSLHNSYWPNDAIDRLPCNVQWGIGIYPAYALTDGSEDHNSTRGNDDSAILVPEFSFDINTAPMLFIHGDADGWASMNSVKVWEKMRAMGIQSELHTLALRSHCFQRQASPDTGSYTWLDRIADFLRDQKILE